MATGEASEWFPLLGAAVASVWERAATWLLSPPDPNLSVVKSAQTTPTTSLNATSGAGEMRVAAGAAVAAVGRAARLVVGLGNHGMPGTRHSVGMEAVTHIADVMGLRWSADKVCKGTVATGTTPDGTPVVLLRPRLLMNVNGRAVAAAARKYGVAPSRVILVHDELDRAVGKVAVKRGGSAKGHNGVRSAMAALQSDSMPRVLVGIDRPPSRADVVAHVLAKFSSRERAMLDATVLPEACRLVLALAEARDRGERGGDDDATG